MYRYPPCLGFPPHSGHHRALSVQHSRFSSVTCFTHSVNSVSVSIPRWCRTDWTQEDSSCGRLQRGQGKGRSRESKGPERQQGLCSPAGQLHSDRASRGLESSAGPQACWVLSGRTRENCVCRKKAATGVCVLSRVQLFATPWAAARQAPLSMGSPRPECWNGLAISSPGGSSRPRN